MEADDVSYRLYTGGGSEAERGDRYRLSEPQRSVINSVDGRPAALDDLTVTGYVGSFDLAMATGVPGDRKTVACIGQ